MCDTEDCATCGKEVDGHQLELCTECAAGLCTDCFNKNTYCKECVELGLNEDE